MRFLLVCSFTLLLVPLVNSKNPRNAPGRTTNIPGIGKLIFYRRGAGLKLIRRGGQLDVKIAKLQAGNRNMTGHALDKIDFEVVREVNDTSTYSVPANRLTVKGTAPNSASMEMIFSMFMDNGTITGEDGNEYWVQKGSLKFNLKIELPDNNGTEVSAKDVFTNIAFKCASGTKNGNKVKAMGKKKASSNRELEAISPCKKARITFSPLFKEGNNWVEMTEGYPKTVQGEQGWSTVMLKFSGKSIFYDPVMDVGDDIEKEISKELGDDTSGSLVDVSSSSFTAFVTTVMIILQYIQF